MTYPDLEHVQPLPWRAMPTADNGVWRLVDANGVPIVPGLTEQEARLICEAVNSYHRHRVQCDQALRLARQATKGWACYARTKAERGELARLRAGIDKVEDGLMAALWTEEVSREQ